MKPTLIITNINKLNFLFTSGMFSLNLKREFYRCCWCLKAKAKQEEIASRVMTKQHSFHQTRTSSVRSTISNSPLQRNHVQYMACNNKSNCISSPRPQLIGMREQPNGHNKRNNPQENYNTKRCSLL